MNQATADSPTFASRAQIIPIGECEVDLGGRALRRGHHALELGSRAFDVLATIALAGGRLVSKSELMEAVWPNTVVEENNIHVQLSAIRKALGADRELIVTVPGRGYQLAVSRRDTPRAQVPSRPRDAEPVPGLTQLANDALIGREAAIAEIRALMDSTRVLTLAGAGGIGKTSLAREVAHRLATEKALDVRSVELAAHRTRHAVIQAFAHSCGLQFDERNEPDARRLAQALAAMPGLLVIDNAEHVIAHVAEIVGLIGRAAHSRLRMLVTSRFRLRVSFEVVYRVGPLALPDADSDAQTTLYSPAVRLFLRRLFSNGQHVDMNGERLSVVKEICRRLEGVPLALELAASRASVLGLEGIRQGLDEPLLYLGSGYRTAQPRHQNLRSTLDWSFDLLSNREQTVFRRLCIFDRPFSRVAACQIAGDAALSSTAVMDCVSELVDKSLVEMRFDSVELQYALSAPARAFGREKLLAAGEIRTIAERHTLYVGGQLLALPTGAAAVDRRPLTRAAQVVPMMGV
ncbi:ATP-binding protein [Paraburkholderia silviterrae]|nr:winged helix-turn-helix domain-containing protein [Paraburkholderia silviterrae]